MSPPDVALRWPTTDPDDLARDAHHLRSIAASLRSESGRWLPRLPDWTGASAEAHAHALAAITTDARRLEDELAVAAQAAGRLEAATRSTRTQITSLATSVAAAERTAHDLRAEADSAAQAAATWSRGVDPSSFAESERLQARAVRARHRAEDATRHAELIRLRATQTADDLVQALDRLDSQVAHDIDDLVRGLPPVHRQHPFSPVDGGPMQEPSFIQSELRATRRALQTHVDALASAVAEIEEVPWSERTWWESVALAHLTEELDLHRRFLSPERQILEWNPLGDGRVVELFGDLSTARHVAVVVPGIMNTIENFDDQLSADAKDLWVESAALDDRTAVVAWLGYDTPELLNAVSKGRAVEHESELRSFVASLPPDAHVTVVAHSYGTVLAAESASRGLATDDLVLLGSPGTRLDNAGEADLEPDAQVFAGVSDSDWVVGRTGYGSVVCPEKVLGVGWLTGLRWLVSPVTGPLSWVTDSCNTDSDGDVKGLSHGINPAHEDFGAIEISTGDVDGHSSYFDQGTASLDAIAQIVTESHPEQR